MIPVLHGVWAAAGGLVNAFEHIETQTVGAGGAASITFSSITSEYKHLQIRGIAKYTGTTIGFASILIRFNSDTSSNYSEHILFGDGANPYSSGSANTTSGFLGYATDSSSSEWSAHVVDILDYASTSKYKTNRVLAGFDKNGSGRVLLRSSNWRSTSAVTSITLIPGDSGTFAQYTTFSLYGVK